MNCISIEDAIKNKKNKNYDQVIDKLQSINDELSVNFKCYGTKNIDDLLKIVFGNQYVKNIFK